MTAVAHVMEDTVNKQLSHSGDDGGSGCDRDAPTRGAAALPQEDVSQRIAAALHDRLGDERFDLWFDRKTRLTVAGNVLVVEAPNGFAARWISSRFQAEMLGAAREVLGRAMEVCVRVAEHVAPPALPAQGAAQGAAARPPTSRAPAEGRVLSSRYTLEEFVVGPCNQLAYHAAQRVAEQPGEQFNPLFLHGHCGLGKTHLLQGICHRFAKLHPGGRWLYLTGEQFTNEYLEAIRSHRTDAFRRRIRSADLLVIDDVHFLSNKKATQEEFLHTFNQVGGCGKQVVLASDCAPRQIQHLSEQLSSRFASGMVLRMDSPDLPTRLEILRRKAARQGWQVSETVLMHIARTAAGSVRELEGLLLQAVAGMSLINAGAADASVVLASLKERTASRGPVAVERIVAVVAEHFGVGTEALLGRRREKEISRARAVAMYLARRHSGMSFPEIGRAMGRKNHSSVIAACQRIEAMISGAELLCWSAPEGPRHQAITDILHDLEAALRRPESPRH